MPLPEGAVFAGYTIVRALGSGGMGEVYLARHPRLPRHDAIKLLPASMSSSGAYRERFALEADLASKLWHPHIVGVHDRGEADGQLWIAMDYVDGTDAARLLTRRYPVGMQAAEVAVIVTAIADALDYAHDQGLLHRDVKPGNIMLAETNSAGRRRVLLTDFGIARRTEDFGGLTTTNMAVGSVAYAAPEQLMGARLDGRADQYALAATAYHLLTGTQLFPHSNPAVVITHHLNVDPPKLPETRDDVAGLDAVLAIALAKNPADRFERCSDFAWAFTEQVDPHATALGTPTQAANRSLAATVSRPAKPPVARASAPSQPRPLSRLAIGAAVLGMGAVAAGAIVYINHNREPGNTAQPGLVTSSAQAAMPQASSAAPMPAAVPVDQVSVGNVLLTPKEINTLLAGTSAPLMQVSETTAGMLNNAKLVDPPECVGVIFTGERSVYAGTAFDAMQHQTFEPPQGASSAGLPELIEQAAVRYPTAEQAGTVFSAATRQWQSCAANPVLVQTRGQNGENGRTFTLSQPEISSGTMAIGMVSKSGEAGDLACQQVLNLHARLLVGVRSCRTPQLAQGQHDADLGSGGDDARQIASAILDKLPPHSQSDTPPLTTQHNTGVDPNQAGAACTPENAAKLSIDDRNGMEIACVNQGLIAPNSPASWQWAQTPPMTTGVHNLGAPCDPQTTQTLARSTDKYLITCLNGGPNAPKAGYWQRYIGPLE